MDASVSVATRVAEPTAIAADTEGQFVAFRCGETNYAIPIMAVREIRSWQPTTSIPSRSAGSRGVLDIRGTVVEVFDLSMLLGGGPIVPTAGSVVLVLSLEERVIGLMVDAVSDIIQTSTAELMPVPKNHSGKHWPVMVSSMVQHDSHLIGILDLDVIFS